MHSIFKKEKFDLEFVQLFFVQSEFFSVLKEAQIEQKKGRAWAQVQVWSQARLFFLVIQASLDTKRSLDRTKKSKVVVWL